MSQPLIINYFLHIYIYLIGFLSLRSYNTITEFFISRFLHKEKLNEKKPLLHLYTVNIIAHVSGWKLNSIPCFVPIFVETMKGRIAEREDSASYQVH